MEEKFSSTSPIFQENEREANRYACRCLRVMALIALLAWVLNLLNIFIVPQGAMNVGMPVCICSFLLPTFLSWRGAGQGRRFKYLIMGCCVLGITVLSVAIPKHTVLAWIAPVLLSCHYYSRKLTVGALAASVACLWAAGTASLFVGEGDPNLTRALLMEEAVITPEVFRDAALFFFLPRSAILVGMAFVCATVARRTRRLLERQAADSAARQRIETELNVATQIQADMLPRIFPAFPEREEFDVYATMNPAKEVGGDFYDFFLVDDDHLAVVIADVSGKGVPAALFMVIAKTLIKNHAQNQEAPGTVFTQTNEQLCEGNDAGLFVTGWMGVLEISTGKFVYVNAGHNPPLLKRAGGTFEWLKSRPGFVLAGMEGVRYRENTLQLEPGDRLYLYTDGVTEATNSHEELFGDERLQNALNEYMDLPVEQFLPKIKECIDAFVGDADQFDDITMLALDYQSKGETEHD